MCASCACVILKLNRKNGAAKQHDERNWGSERARAFDEWCHTDWTIANTSRIRRLYMQLYDSYLKHKSTSFSSLSCKQCARVFYICLLRYYHAEIVQVIKPNTSDWAVLKGRTTTIDRRNEWDGEKSCWLNNLFLLGFFPTCLCFGDDEMVWHAWDWVNRSIIFFFSQKYPVTTWLTTKHTSRKWYEFIKKTKTHNLPQIRV